VKTPPSPIAAQKLTLGHETPSSAGGGLWIALEAQAARPPAGSAEVRTLPAQSTATHSETDGQEIPVISVEVGIG
jgi:hypothetical protein